MACYFKKIEAHKSKTKKFWKYLKYQIHALEDNEDFSEPVIRYNSKSLNINFIDENNNGD